MKLNVSSILFLVVFSAKEGLTKWVFGPAGRLTLQPSFKCGVTEVKRINSKIVGGEDVQPGQYPWMALIYYDTMDEKGTRTLTGKCGGALISRKHILTASHCSVEESLGIYAHLGVHSAKEANPERPATGTRFIRIKRTIPYDDQHELPDDIAILELISPVRFTPRIKPICLPHPDEKPTSAIVAGWGNTNSELYPPKRTTLRRKIVYPHSDVLQHVELQIFSEDRCDAIEEFNGTIHICAGFSGGGKDACQGDSGGPLFVEEDGISYIIGIVSLGYGCADPAWLAIYTRVSYYLPWIKQLIGKS